MNPVTAILVILAGLGALFIVSWFESADEIREERMKQFKNKKEKNKNE